MPLRARLFLPRSWCLSRPRFPSQNRSPALWGLSERAGEASWCWVHAMGSHLRADGAPAIHGNPVFPTGRCEQRVLSGVKDGPTAQKLDQPVDERVNHPPGHTALRRHIAGGVLGSPQAVGGRLGVSRRPVAARAECLWGGRSKLVDSSAPVRQLAPRTQPARAPNKPGTSRTQPARSPASPRPCVRVPAPRAPAGFGEPEPDNPAPPRAPSPRRTAAGGPPSPSPSGAMMGDHRLRHHPRRSTFTAATLRRRLASTILAHAAAIPLAAFEFGFIVRCSSSSYVVYLLRWRTPPMAEVRSGTHVPAREREPRRPARLRLYGTECAAAGGRFR